MKKILLPAFLVAAALLPSAARAYDYVLCITQSVSTASGSVDMAFDWCFDKASWDGDGCVVLRTVTPKLSGAQTIGSEFLTFDADTHEVKRRLTLTEIGDGAFSNSPGLQSVTLPATCRSVGDYAFASCPALASVTLSDTIRSLGKALFSGSRITELTLPACLEEIDGNPALGCSLLKTINVPEDNPCFRTDDDGLLYDWWGEVLLACPPAKQSVELPSELLEIAPDAFYGCKRLTSIVALCDEPVADDDILMDTPARRLTVEADAYALDWGDPLRTEWKSRTFKNTGVPPGLGTYETDGAVITYSTSGDTATILSVKAKSGASSFKVPSSIDDHVVTAVGPCAFANNRALEAVEIPATCQTIGDFAFSNCTALSSVTLSYGVRYIGNRPFVNTIVQKISLPDSLLDMYGNVAAGALFATEITVSDSSHFVKSSDGCIYNRDMTRLYACPGRAESSVTLPPTLVEIMPEAFYGCFRLDHLYIPATVMTIGSKTFNVAGIWPDVPAPESKPKLTSVYYQGATPVAYAADDIYEGAPDELTSYAFTDSWSGDTWKDRPLVIDAGGTVSDVLTLTDDDGNIWGYTVTDDVATIVSLTPAEGQALLSLALPTSLGKYVVKAIGPAALSNLRGLTTLSVPDTYESIGNYAFSNCTSLARVTVPSGVSSLGKAPFCGTKIASLELPSTVTSLNGNPLVGSLFVTSVSVDANNPALSAADGLLFDKAQTTLLACVPSATEVTLPETVTAIADDAFDGCYALALVTALGDEPAADDDIFANAASDLIVTADAYGCDWGDPVPTVWKQRLFVNNGTPDPEGIQTYTDDDGVVWTYVVTNREIVLGSTGTAIPATTEGMVTVPGSISVNDALGYLPVVRLDEKAFAGCAGISEISLSASLREIAPGAFNGCTSLEQFTVASASETFSARNGVLYSKDGRTLVKVPAGFRFKTTITETATGTTSKITETETVNPDASTTITVTASGPSTPVASTVVRRFTPEIGPQQLFDGVTLIADCAFCDCGTLPAGTIASGTLVTTDGTTTSNEQGQVVIAVGTDAVGGKSVQKELTRTYAEDYRIKKDYIKIDLTTAYDIDVPFPDIPASVAYTQQSFYGSVWYGDLPADALPALSLSAPADEVAASLAGVEDAKLRANLKDGASYAAFRSWAAGVKNASGESKAGLMAVRDSKTAWISYALDSDRLLAELPTTVKIGKSPFGTQGACVLELEIDGVNIGSAALEENLRKVFSIKGTESLSSPLAESNVTVTSLAPTADGKAKANVAPASGTPASFFFSVGIRD